VTATVEQINRAGRVLGAAARVVHTDREALQHPVVQEMAGELRALLQALTRHSSPWADLVVDAHMRRIGELATQLPVLDQEPGR
jgi:hypothetical protein